MLQVCVISIYVGIFIHALNIGIEKEITSDSEVIFFTLLMSNED